MGAIAPITQDVGTSARSFSTFWGLSEDRAHALATRPERGRVGYAASPGSGSGTAGVGGSSAGGTVAGSSGSAGVPGSGSAGGIGASGTAGVAGTSGVGTSSLMLDRYPFLPKHCGMRYHSYPAAIEVGGAATTNGRGPSAGTRDFRVAIVGERWLFRGLAFAPGRGGRAAFRRREVSSTPVAQPELRAAARWGKTELATVRS
jgi:hypothetical protein